MTAVEDRLRETLAERATLSHVDPDAWEKVVARSRRRRRPGWAWPTWARLLVPVAAAAAVVVIIVAATTLAGHVGQRQRPPGSASTSASPPGGGRPAAMEYVVRQIPPVTPFVPISLSADHHLVKNYLWFGYVPGDKAAGVALCQYNDGGVYNEYARCASGGVPAGAPARLVMTDGSGWMRLGVAARQVTSVTAVLPGGRTVAGKVESVRGVPDKVWAVSYPVTPAARIVFRDAAGHQVTQLNAPGDQPVPSQPSHGGIALFRYGKNEVTAYQISGDRIGYWFGSGSSSWSDVPVSKSALGVDLTGGLAPLPEEWFGYAPSGTAHVALRLASGRQYTSSRVIPGWAGSGVVFWGPLELPKNAAVNYDTIVIAYDASGHVLREVPFIFIG